MKRPECYVDDYEFCHTHDEDYPCKPWRRWTKSKDYRIQLLEERVVTLSDARSRQDGELVALRDKIHRLDLIVRGGLLLQASDIARGVGGGSLTMKETIDYIEIGGDTVGGLAVNKIPGCREFTVVYESPDGTTYENGHEAHTGYTTCLKTPI